MTVETKDDDIYAILKNAWTSKQISNLQFKVYLNLLRVPKGKVTTYGELARAIKCGSAQPIGSALKKNPFAPQIPCHRVVKSDRSLGGFNGSIKDETVTKKINLLMSEGVQFEEEQKGSLTNVKVHEKFMFKF